MSIKKTKTEKIKIFPAHIRKGEIQSCEDHSLNTAKYAQADLESIHLGNTAYLAGLLHDCGKYTKEFSEYITNAYAGKVVRKGSVIHTFAGSYYLLKQFHNSKTNNPYSPLTAELIAYAVGAHHGLFDCINEDHESGFAHRLTKQPEYEEKAIENFRDCFNDIEYDKLFQSASQEIEKIVSEFPSIAKADNNDNYNEEILFYIGLLARLLCSAIMDGDRRDTAEFMNHEDFDSCIRATAEIWDECINSLHDFIDSFPNDTAIQHTRRSISDFCFAFGEEPTGIYRLDVPTGGGKTLSSLRFALNHARLHGKKRIIYTAPLLSILDQNAEVIRQAIKDDRLVLEHHSNIVRDEKNDTEYASKYDLLTETWDSPIIITTLVQLLNTFFSDKTSCVRRFQSLIDSIIIIDEVQSVPDYMLSMFNLTINFISRVCNTTVILCSATQPCLEQIPHQLNLSDKAFIPPENYEEYVRIFKRTELIDKGNYRLAELPCLMHEALQGNSSLLIICNTRKEASELYIQVKDTFHNCFHLSASMCMAHRKDVLQQIYTSLDSGEETVCVSTQVIEAGVDISFDCVIRLTAGIDNIVQAAGRCNRNGEIDGTAKVYIVRCIDEKLGSLQTVIKAQDATNNLLVNYRSRPESYKEDLASEESVNFYYRCLYNSYSKTHFDFPLKGRPSLFEMLSDNRSYRDNCKAAETYNLHQAFRTAGDLFEVFNQDSESVIVPFGAGRDIIAELCGWQVEFDVAYLKELLTKAKNYSVSIYRNQFFKLLQDGAIHGICDGKVLVLDEDWYDNRTGLLKEPVEGEDRECSILIL